MNRHIYKYAQINTYIYVKNHTYIKYPSTPVGSDTISVAQAAVLRDLRLR